LLDSFLAVDEYCLDDDTREVLVLWYNTFRSKQAKKKKWVVLNEDALVLGHKSCHKMGADAEPITLQDLQLMAARLKGDPFERDVNCDSEWMKRNMMKMGEAIQEAYWWLPLEQEIEFIMDNAGGHGTKDAIEW
jgi:hypothetical protein